MMNNHKLTSNDEITKQVRSLGMETWGNLCNYVQNLNYGRNANRSDFNLVIKEQKGTCSSKHAFLKNLADLNNIDVQLVLGIYKMKREHTPKIGSVLHDNNLDFIPEAHCYLKVKNRRYDFTFKNSAISNIEKDILIEEEIVPKQTIYYKNELHKKFIKNWIQAENVHYTFEQLWHIRENCIKNLTQ